GYYIFDRIKYGDWLQLLGGLRKSDYTESNHTTGVVSYHSKPLSYSYGAVVQPWHWASIYGTYIEGLESTPPAPLTAVNSGQQLSPSTSTQWEGGIKIQPHDGLLLTASYFLIDRDSTYVNNANVYVKDGRARYKGVELSATGEVTEDFSLYASALFLSAKQVSGAPTVITGTSISPTAVGKRIDNSAKFTGSVAGEYRLEKWVPGLAVTAGVYYVGKRAVNPLNQAFVPGYTLLDLGASYTTDSLWKEPVTFRINADNVTGKRYFSSAGGLYIAEGTPTTVKFSISTNL
ncbi:MAG TPA: TonB-dependent receptor, partial [Rhizomicrobium sp.]|nr:TonB-dependent receptor [Rhizomicrobium sp.]